MSNIIIIISLYIIIDLLLNIIFHLNLKVLLNILLRLTPNHFLLQFLSNLINDLLLNNTQLTLQFQINIIKVLHLLLIYYLLFILYLFFLISRHISLTTLIPRILHLPLFDFLHLHLIITFLYQSLLNHLLLLLLKNISHLNIRSQRRQIDLLLMFMHIHQLISSTIKDRMQL
jgi:hypothetical protein